MSHYGLSLALFLTSRMLIIFTAILAASLAFVLLVVITNVRKRSRSNSAMPQTPQVEKNADKPLSKIKRQPGGGHRPL